MEPQEQSSGVFTSAQIKGVELAGNSAAGVAVASRWQLEYAKGLVSSGSYRVLRGENIVGRAPSATFYLDDSMVSRTHLRLFCTANDSDPVGGCYLEDLGSRNGTEINGVKLVGLISLKPGDQIILGTTTLTLALSESAAALDAADTRVNHSRSNSGYDTPAKGVTEAIDWRSEFHRLLESAITQARETGVTFSLLYVDIDDLSAINQLHGRLVGDGALAHLYSLLQCCCGTPHAVLRYHDDELVVLMPQTDRGGACAVAEKMRAAVEANAYRAEGKTVHMTVSIGCTEIKLTDTPESMFYTAKSNAVTAKLKGGNRVFYS